jgi:hypothetical protein
MPDTPLLVITADRLVDGTGSRAIAPAFVAVQDERILAVGAASISPRSSRASSTRTST